MWTTRSSIKQAQKWKVPVLYKQADCQNVKISMDGRGRAYDNIFIERLWRSVKYEEIYLRRYQNIPECKTGLGEYLGFMTCPTDNLKKRALKLQRDYIVRRKPKMNSLIKKGWDSFAEKYNEMVKDSGDVNHRLIINPCLLKLAGRIKGKIIFDVGCGQGYFTRILARQGAKVYGVDISSQMINLAREQEDKHNQGIKYLNQEASKALPFKNGFFDMIIFNMSLMNIKNISKVFGNITKHLKHHGKLIFSILHPCFINKNSGWLKDESYLDGSRKLLYYKIVNYFNTGINKCKWGNMKKPIPHFHRTIEDYVALLRQHNLFISDMREPKSNLQYRNRLTKDDPVWEVNDRIPFYLVVECIKNKVQQ